VGFQRRFGVKDRSPMKICEALETPRGLEYHGIVLIYKMIPGGGAGHLHVKAFSHMIYDIMRAE